MTLYNLWRCVIAFFNRWCAAHVNLRGVLGNKCAGHHNLKTVKIREIVWKKNIQQILFCIEKLLRGYPLDELLRQQRLLKVSNWRYPLQPEHIRNLQCCGFWSGRRDLGSGAFLTPGSGSGIHDLDLGWVKSQDQDPGSGSGTKNPDHISENLETIFLG